MGGTFFLPEPKFKRYAAEMRGIIEHAFRVPRFNKLFSGEFISFNVSVSGTIVLHVTYAHKYIHTALFYKKYDYSFWYL